MNHIGIDLSLTSPAVCVHAGDEFSINNCKFYFMTDMAKRANMKLVLRDGITIEAIPALPFRSNPERYQNITEMVMRIVDQHNVTNVLMEDYAFTATGQVFQIAENAGLLKQKFWYRKIPVTLMAPTMIKKHATGKGNATKEMMQEAFIQETGFELKSLLGQTEKQWSPSGDIVDAYYVTKTGLQNA